MVRRNYCSVLWRKFNIQIIFFPSSLFSPYIFQHHLLHQFPLYPLHWPHQLFFFLILTQGYFFYCFLERMEGREWGERHTHRLVAFHTCPNRSGDQTYNPGTYWESNPRPCHVWVSTLTTEPTGQGPFPPTPTLTVCLKPPSHSQWCYWFWNVSSLASTLDPYPDRGKPSWAALNLWLSVAQAVFHQVVFEGGLWHLLAELEIKLG